MTTKLMLSEFPFTWPAGKILKNVLNNIVKSIDERFPSPYKNFVIDATWANSPHMIKEISKEYENFGHIDNLFFVALFDPMVIGIPFPRSQDFKFYQVGNVNEERFYKYRFDFHAILISKIFKEYTTDELQLKFDNFKYYLSYQNKPWDHRQYYTHLLINNNLIDKGVVTLSDMNGTNKEQFKYPNLKVFKIEENIPFEYLQDNGMTKTNNPYSLGEISIWQNSFLNVVHETFHNTIQDSYILISEKIHKPLIGLRPFILNGHRSIYNHLEESGFYTFEEYWKEINFRNLTSMESNVEGCVYITNKICQMPLDEIKSMYLDMMPKLIHNRNRFFEYAEEQHKKIGNLFND